MLKEYAMTVREILDEWYYGTDAIEDTQIVCNGIYLPVHENLDRKVISVCEHEECVKQPGQIPYRYETRLVFHVYEE